MDGLRYLHHADGGLEQHLVGRHIGVVELVEDPHAEGILGVELLDRVGGIGAGHAPEGNRAAVSFKPSRSTRHTPGWAVLQARLRVHRGGPVPAHLVAEAG